MGINRPPGRQDPRPGRRAGNAEPAARLPRRWRTVTASSDRRLHEPSRWRSFLPEPPHNRRIPLPQRRTPLQRKRRTAAAARLGRDGRRLREHRAPARPEQATRASAGGISAFEADARRSRRGCPPAIRRCWRPRETSMTAEKIRAAASPYSLPAFWRIRSRISCSRPIFSTGRPLASL